MSGAPSARDLARKVLERAAGGSYLTLALDGELKRARLSAADAGLCTEITYGTMKMLRRLDWTLAAYTRHGLERVDPVTLTALRLGAYQMLFSRVPAHAAVDDAVESVRRRRGATQAGFANAVLRRLGREGEAAPPPRAQLALHLGVVGSAPDWIVDELLRQRTPEEAEATLAAWNRPAAVWLRVNPLRATPQEALAALRAERPDADITQSARLATALRVARGGDPSATQAFAQGWVTPQDVGAQRVGALAGAAAGETVLDACAGVGGKATQLAELAGDQARVIACDLSPRKLALCADSAHRLGLHGVTTLAGDARTLPLPDADRVLLDAPCSGLGVLRRHPEAKWRPHDNAALITLQRELLDALVARVRPGGSLTYAVCTFVTAEGREQIAALCARNPQLTVEESWTTWPDASGDGDDADTFFAARLRRSA